MGQDLNSTVEVDLGYKRIRANLNQVNNASVKVGILAGRIGPAGKSIAEYAAANEFGVGVPERSFIRSTVDEQRQKHNRILDSLLNSVLDGKKSVSGALHEFALVAQADIRTKIVELRTPPNAESTIAAKGSSNPLIDTGAMRQAVEFEVEV